MYILYLLDLYSGLFANLNWEILQTSVNSLEKNYEESVNDEAREGRKVLSQTNLLKLALQNFGESLKKLEK